jgi:predicted transposase/invertase (TIGR01784 family)
LFSPIFQDFLRYLRKGGYTQQQLHEGQDYLELKPTISISFLDHVLFPDVPDYHLRFHLLEQTHHFAFTQDIEFHVLELPIFKKSAEYLTNGLDIWLYFLCHAAKIDTGAVPAALQKPLVLRAFEELRMLTHTEIERERYDARRKAQPDYNTGLKVARMEGQEEGRKEGLNKGECIGMIHAFERLLNRPDTPTGQLLLLSLEELTRLGDDRQQLLSKK